ncbi:MAG: lytic transglycosylase domain-containing protein [Rikenellaceae bacterium]
MFFKEVKRAKLRIAVALVALSATSIIYSVASGVEANSQAGMEPMLSADDNYMQITPSEVGVRIAPLPKELDFAGEKVPIELPYVREAIEREMLTTSCMHTSTTLSLRRTTRYFPIIEPILKKNNIPEDFKYLCVTESGLNPNAVSPAKACGLWQFVASAAKDYGVETGDNVDLRYNIEIATQAACDYLNEAYKRFGSWTLAAASYNAGQAGVSRRMKTQGVDDYWDLYLPEETMRYVPRILSFKLMIPEPEKYGFLLKKSDYFPTFENYTEVQIAEKNIDWCEFATRHNTNYRQLRILNPWIRSYSYANATGKSYTVKVPNADFKKLGY